MQLVWLSAQHQQQHIAARIRPKNHAGPLSILTHSCYCVALPSHAWEHGNDRRVMVDDRARARCEQIQTRFSKKERKKEKKWNYQTKRVQIKCKCVWNKCEWIGCPWFHAVILTQPFYKSKIVANRRVGETSHHNANIYMNFAEELHEHYRLRML